MPSRWTDRSGNAVCETRHSIPIPYGEEIDGLGARQVLDILRPRVQHLRTRVAHCATSAGKAKTSAKTAADRAQVREGVVVRR